MNTRFAIQVAILYLVVMGIMVFKDAYAEENILNMVFSASTIVVVVALIKALFVIKMEK